MNNDSIRIESPSAQELKEQHATRRQLLQQFYLHCARGSKLLSSTFTSLAHHPQQQKTSSSRHQEDLSSSSNILLSSSYQLEREPLLLGRASSTSSNTFHATSSSRLLPQQQQEGGVSYSDGYDDSEEEFDEEDDMEAEEESQPPAFRTTTTTRASRETSREGGGGGHGTKGAAKELKSHQALMAALFVPYCYADNSSEVRVAVAPRQDIDAPFSSIQSSSPRGTLKHRTSTVHWDRREGTATMGSPRQRNEGSSSSSFPSALRPQWKTKLVSNYLEEDQTYLTQLASRFAWSEFLQRRYLLLHALYIFCWLLVGATVFSSCEGIGFDDGIFVAASAVSCTGLASVDVTIWSAVGNVFRHLLMIGGGAVFTSAFQPMFRWLAVRQLRATLDERLRILDQRSSSERLMARKREGGPVPVDDDAREKRDAEHNNTEKRHDEDPATSSPKPIVLLLRCRRCAADPDSFRRRMAKKREQAQREQKQSPQQARPVKARDDDDEDDDDQYPSPQGGEREAGLATAPPSRSGSISSCATGPEQSPLILIDGNPLQQPPLTMTSDVPTVEPVVRSEGDVELCPHCVALIATMTSLQDALEEGSRINFVCMQASWCYFLFVQSLLVLLLSLLNNCGLSFSVVVGSVISSFHSAAFSPLSEMFNDPAAVFLVGSACALGFTMYPVGLRAALYATKLALLACTQFLFVLVACLPFDSERAANDRGNNDAETRSSSSRISVDSPDDLEEDNRVLEDDTAQQRVPVIGRSRPVPPAQPPQRLHLQATTRAEEGGIFVNGHASSQPVAAMSSPTAEEGGGGASAAAAVSNPTQQLSQQQQQQIVNAASTHTHLGAAARRNSLIRRRPIPNFQTTAVPPPPSLPRSSSQGAQSSTDSSSPRSPVAAPPHHISSSPHHHQESINSSSGDRTGNWHTPRRSARWTPRRLCSCTGMLEELAIAAAVLHDSLLLYIDDLTLLLLSDSAVVNGSYHSFLFSAGDTLYVAVAWFLITFVQFLPYTWQQWGVGGVLEGLSSWGQKVNVAWNQSILTRFSGGLFLDSTRFTSAHVAIVLFAMYVPPIPTVPNTHVLRGKLDFDERKDRDASTVVRSYRRRSKKSHRPTNVSEEATFGARRRDSTLLERRESALMLRSESQAKLRHRTKRETEREEDAEEEEEQTPFLSRKPRSRASQEEYPVGSPVHASYLEAIAGSPRRGYLGLLEDGFGSPRQDSKRAPINSETSDKKTDRNPASVDMSSSSSGMRVLHIASPSAGKAAWRIVTSRFFWLLTVSIIIMFANEHVIVPLIQSSPSFHLDMQTRTIFEVVSGYTGSGMTLPINGVLYSFSGSLDIGSKMLIALVMFFGRHRGIEIQWTMFP